MTSSLAAQLANIGTVDRDRLQAATSKFRPSFLFPPRQAASLSNEDIHSLAYNGYLALLAQDSRFERFENPIFGEKAKLTDRTILTKEENAKLDAILEGLLRLLAGKFLLKSAGKVLEWLIRRFRINDFNVEELVRLILPYHETPQFVQMLQIIKLDGHAKFKALEAVKVSLQPMPRHHLLTAMSKTHDLFRFIASSIEPYRNQGCLNSTLIAFWAGSVLAYIERTKNIQPQDMSILLPVILQGIKSDNRDLRLGSYIILSHLAARSNLSQETAQLLAESILDSIRTIQDSEDQEAALTTLAILCAHQDSPLAPFSQKAAALSAPLLPILADLAQKSDITALLKPLLSAILKVAQDQPSVAEHLQNLVAPPSCPLQITQVAARIMLDVSLSQKAIPLVFGKLLLCIEQRLPEDTSLLSFASDAENRRLVHLLQKLGESNWGQDRTVVPGSNVKHRDAAIRAARLADEMQGDKGDDERHANVLLDALSDTSPEVAGVLFGAENTSRLSQLSSAQPSAVFERCVTGSSNEVDASVVIARADFLLNTFVEAVSEEWRARIIMEFLWPHLLATKRTSTKSSAIWKLILRLDYKKWPELKAAQDLTIDMESDAASFNDKIVDILCELATRGDTAGTRFSTFLIETGLQRETTRSKKSILSQLVVLRLLAKGDCRYASAVLDRPLSAVIGVHSCYGSSQLPTLMARRIWTKSASPKTQNVLAGALFGTAMHAVAASEPKALWMWLSAYSDIDEATKQHRVLIARVYELAHSSNLNTESRRSILENLLTKQLRVDVLAFLAEIYTSDRADNLRLAALYDAAAIIEQHRGLDYQMLLPSLVAALVKSKPSVCQGVFRVIHTMAASAANTQSQGLYGLDKFYGESSDKVKFLDNMQYGSLLQTIVQDEASLLVDGAYIQQALINALGNKENMDSHPSRQALIAYFVSHAEAWRSIPARISLLSSIQRVLDDKRANLFQPFLAEASQSAHALICDEDTTCRTYWNLVLKGYRSRIISDELFQTILHTLQSTRTDTLGVTLRDELRNAIQKWFLPAATGQQRNELFTCVSSLVLDRPNTEVVRNLQILRSCLSYADVLQTEVAALRDSLTNRAMDGQTAKKARSSLAGSNDSELPRLGLLLENVDVSSTTATIELLATVLGLLAGLVDMSTSQADLDYYVQLTITRASEIVASIPDLEEEVDLRVGPVLETIRVSGNPATSNGALNLMADLARLAPAQVAQNVMPIFTFMGTNVLQRDDAQSTRVVDKTIRTIVPALIKQRRQRSTSSEQLVTDMEEVLRVFVDAATHVPRHRRLHLFIRFVDILGPADFLAPVCTLMVDKVALKYVKTRDPSLLALPLGVYAHFSGILQLTAVQQQLLDVHKKTIALNSDIIEESVSSRHSSPVTPAESPLLPVIASRRTVLALLYFLQEVVSSKKLSTELQRVRHSDENAVEAHLTDVTHACIQLMCIEPQKLSQSDLAQLSAGSQTLLKSFSRVMATAEFASTLSLLVGNSVVEVSDLGIDMLVERLSHVKQHHRRALGPALHSALIHLSGAITKSDSKAKRLHALLRIRALAAYCADSEAAQLYQALVSAIDQAEKTASATFNLQVLLLASETIPIIGGRIIPAVYRLLALTSSLVGRHLTNSTVAASRNIATTGFSVLELLLQSVPTFIAKEIKTVLDLCVSVESSAIVETEAVGSYRAASSRVISTATKKVPPQVLYQALQELYTMKIQQDTPHVANVVTILAQTIRQTSTRTVAELHKSLFSQLLVIFDARSSTHVSSKFVDDIEKAAVGAFMQLVLKLNEVTFRPLFMRLVDWTASEDALNVAPSVTARPVVFFKVLDRLLLQLKSIAMPYYGLALDTVIGVLQGNPEEKLWTSVLTSLRRALEVDSASFWTESRMAKIVLPLAEQCRRPYLERSHLLEAYQSVVKSFANAATAHFDILQKLHYAFMQLAKEDNQSIQLATIRALQAMWESEAQPELIAFKPESMPTIAELLEAGGQVEEETKALLATMANGEEDAEMALDDDDDAESGSQDGNDSE